MPMLMARAPSIGRARAGVPAGGGGDVYWGSEWRNSTGATEAAFRDGTVFDSISGTPSNGAANIDAAGASLVGRGNYFRCIAHGTAGLVVIKNPLITAGTDHYGRCYVRNDLSSSYTFNHLLAWGGIGPPINMTMGMGYSGSIRRMFHKTVYRADGSQTPYPYEIWTPGTLGVSHYSFTSGAWYLWEWYINYSSSTAYALTIWVSAVDANGNITSELFSNSTIFRTDSVASGEDLASLQGVAVDFGVSTDQGEAAMAKFVVGNEGSVATATDENVYMASVGFSLTGRLMDTDLGLG